jgi:16S rRNA (cytidine1402-2'-O)-methyltransferase
MSTLYLVATPIGNLEDLSFRAVRILGEVDALACEDTRFTRTIYERHGIPSPRTIFSYHEHNEERAGGRIMDLLRGGATVALCTDGGYPGISDPGYRIANAALDGGFRVEVIPGPGAVATALLASGLSAASYTFKGFPPRKPGPRKRFLAMERDLPHTLVVFESPFRTGRLLADALEILGDRKAAVCVELTKKFEEVHRGYLGELAERFREAKIRGEVTVVIAGNSPKFAKPDEDPPEET